MNDTSPIALQFNITLEPDEQRSFVEFLRSVCRAPAASDGQDGLPEMHDHIDDYFNSTSTFEDNAQRQDHAAWLIFITARHLNEDLAKTLVRQIKAAGFHVEKGWYAARVDGALEATIHA